MLDYSDLRRELDYFLEEHSISELLEMVFFAVQCREDELKEKCEEDGMIKHGKWETNKVAFMKTCSLCGKSVDQSHDYNFCPECGAKMDLEGE